MTLQFPLKIHIRSYCILGEGNLAKLNNTCPSGKGKKKNVTSVNSKSIICEISLQSTFLDIKTK